VPSRENMPPRRDSASMEEAELSASSTGSTPPRRAPLLLRVIGWLAVLVTLVWFGRFAYVRMTTLPLTLEEMYTRLGPFDVPPVDPAEDVSADLNEVLAAVSVPPPFNLPAPAGMKWDVVPAFTTLAIEDVFAGPWTPDDRPYLRVCIDYFESPAITKALDSVAGLRGHPWLMWQWFPFASSKDAVGNFTGLGNLARLLAARSRYSVEDKRDWSAAADDLRTVLWLSENASRGFFLPYRAGTGLEEIALTQLIHLACEQPISEAAAENILNTIGGLTDWRERWRDAVGNQLILERVILGARYADLPDRSGWLILGGSLNEAQTVAGGGAPAVTRRSRLWNLLTVFYHDLATVDQKYIDLYGAVRETAFMSFGTGRRVVEDLQDGPPVFSPLDGIAMTVADTNQDVDTLSRMHTYLFRSIALRRAAIIVVALSEYRATKDEYPEKLAALSPQFIEAIPDDPYSDRPFGYRKEAVDRFQLWACGEDMDDDGARFAVDERGRPSDPREDNGELADQIFILPRGKALVSARLVPIGGATSAPANGLMANTNGDTP
jgi:hypothetical protein